MAKDLKKFAHPDYLKWLPDYIKIRDCFDGERAIKEKGVAYLPQLSGQLQADYDNYKLRALFFPITGKTCTSMVGLATAKPPKSDYPADMEPYFVDSEAEYQFSEVYVSVFTETVLLGRYGVLIDGPAVGEGDPTLCAYLAENIVNWAKDPYTGKLTMLLLREFKLVAGKEAFERSVVTRFRHCFIQNNVYVVHELDDDLQIISQTVPTFSGQPIDYIPFVPFGASGVHMEPDKPPMLDIATINLSHYLTSADLEWGRHIVGLPTPVVSGVDSGTKLKIGGTAAWILPVVEAKAYYLEFQGQGLQSLEKAMTDKVGLMASISARLVDNSTRGSEAAETVRLRYMNEAASLIHIIGSVETGINVLYTMLAKLKGSSGKPTIKFPREILGVGITFKDLAVMFEAYMAGTVSKESLLYNLRRLDALDPNRTDEEELKGMRPPPPAVDPNAPKPVAANNPPAKAGT